MINYNDLIALPCTILSLEPQFNDAYHSFAHCLQALAPSTSVTRFPAFIRRTKMLAIITRSQSKKLMTVP